MAGLDIRCLGANEGTVESPPVTGGHCPGHLRSPCDNSTFVQLGSIVAIRHNKRYPHSGIRGHCVGHIRGLVAVSEGCF